MPKVEISEATIRASLSALRAYLEMSYGLLANEVLSKSGNPKVINANIENATRAFQELEEKLLSL